MSKKKYRVSADIGGTFTDIVFYDTETGAYYEGKTLSTPENLSNAIMTGIGERIQDFDEIDFFVHGTTSGLNAFLERKGARVALVTTKGFRDVYEIGRGNRPQMYDLHYKKSVPLLSRLDVYEVEERLLAGGGEWLPVNEDSVRAAAEEIKKGDYSSVAVCLLHSYENPEHEIQVGKILSECLPGYSVSLSHTVVREWREYERTSTTVINAYIAPIVQKYLESLEERMKDRNFEKNVHVMQSGGGVITAEIAKETPIQTLLSGPVGGAVGNATLSNMLGYKNMIGVDMGGTSYDVSMVVDGKPDVSTEVHLEGFPILVPMVNIYTIGAGGGSIAWLEAGGLRVGPRSAGSVPGPACYGRGGTQPTITDANVVLGRLDPEGFLGGRMTLDKEASIRAMETISGTLHMTPQETAEGICRIADAKMADAIRQLTVRKGIDPREFVLVAFGGAGPMHACTTAEELDIETVLIPEMPGIFSAWGMLQSDIRQDLSRTLMITTAKADVADICQKFGEMEKEAKLLLEKQNIPGDRCEFVQSADMRYLGQEYTVRVNFTGNGTITEEVMKQLEQDFHQLHHQIFGHSNPAGEVEIVTLRLVGLGKLDKIEKKKSGEYSEAAPVPRKSQEAIFGGKAYDAKVYDRSNLITGQKIPGPAIIEEFTTTSVIPPNWEITIDEYRNMIVKRLYKEEV